MIKIKSFIILFIILLGCEPDSEIKYPQEINNIDLNDFGIKIEHAILSKDTIFLKNVFDIKYVIQLFKNEFKTGNPNSDLNFIKTVGYKQFIDLLLRYSIEDNKSKHFSFERVIKENGSFKLIFAYYDEFVEYDFLELVIIKKDSRYLIVDSYDYYFDYKFSSYILSHISNLRRYGRNRGLYIRSIKNLDRVKTYMKVGDYYNAIILLQDLPIQFKFNMPFISIFNNVSKHVSSESNFELMKQFVSRGNVGIKCKLLHEIRNFLLTGEFNLAYDKLRDLEKFVGENIITLLLEANIAFENHDYNLALKAYSEVIQINDQFFLGYFGKIEVLIMQNNYTEAVILINTMIEEKGYCPLDITNYLSIYPNFLSTEHMKNILSNFSECK